MINLLAYLLVSIMSINFFLGSVAYQGVNRTLMTLPISLIENAVVTFDEDLGDTNYPYFDETIINASIKEYFEANLYTYVSSYQYAIAYFDTNFLLPCTLRCQAVKISLSTNILGFRSYEKAINFSLVEGSLINV